MQAYPFYGAAPHLEITKNRRNGYLDAMKKYKIPVDDSMILLCDTRERHLHHSRPAGKRNRPDGFFAINDETASHTVCVLQTGRRKVPDEVSICGIHRRSHCPKHRPEADYRGAAWRGSRGDKSAFSILTGKLEGEEKSNNKIVRTNLAIRGTTK